METTEFELSDLLSIVDYTSEQINTRLRVKYADIEDDVSSLYCIFSHKMDRTDPFRLMQDLDFFFTTCCESLTLCMAKNCTEYSLHNLLNDVVMAVEDGTDLAILYRMN